MCIRDRLQATVNAMDKDFSKLDKGFDGIMKTGEKCFSAIAAAAGVASLAVAMCIRDRVCSLSLWMAADIKI